MTSLVFELILGLGDFFDLVLYFLHKLIRLIFRGLLRLNDLLLFGLDLNQGLNNRGLHSHELSLSLILLNLPL